MNLRVIAEPSAEPVSLELARQHLREDFDAEDEFDQDAVLPVYIQAAREYAEGATGLLLTDALMEWRVDQFDTVLQFPVAPVGSIDSVTYVDQAGAEQVVAGSVYVLDDHPQKPALRLRYGQAWPTARGEANAVRIRFRGAHSETDSPPRPVKKSIQQAMLLMIGHWYENREEVVIGSAANTVPMAAAALLYINRVDMGV